ncbi:unnamed protein product [Rotaria magnacalcarata]
MNSFAAGILSLAIVSTDFDYDNHSDVAVANYGGETVTVHMGVGNGTFLNRRTYISSSSSAALATVTVGDFNGDNHRDIIFNLFELDYFNIVFDGGSGAMFESRLFDINEQPCEIALYDFNDDSRLDFALTHNFMDPVLGTRDWTMNGCLDAILSSLATLIIIIRILWQHQRSGAHRTIRQCRRQIIIQLIPLSALYIIVWLSCVICFVITFFTSAPFLTAFYSAHLCYFQYIGCVLCPFVYLFGSSDIREVFKRYRLVQPITNVVQLRMHH